jgi:two-component system sensor histidine kinase VanS
VITKNRGIFFKVFIYTTVFLIAIVSVTIALFYQQFTEFFHTAQVQQLQRDYQSLYETLHDMDSFQMIDTARNFFEHNQSFAFRIMEDGERVLFHTPNFAPEMANEGFRLFMNLGEGYTLVAHNLTATQAGTGIFTTSLVAFAIIMLIAISAAAIFARQMTSPIKKLADNTKQMANLQDVPPQPKRNDEIGNLARNVHSMYDKLKETISKLEDEILRVREMEESQRYFFSAASHELKTPIAAASVLLEGMVENIGDYKDHPKYLRECIKLMDSQNNIISEIFELVNLHDEKIIPNPEKLNICDTVMSVLPNHQTLAEANGQKISVNIPQEHYCIADKEMLKKVLSNVILNAVQNTPANGELKIWSEPVADQYRVCVLNIGVTIKKDVLSKLFDPFYRVDKARSQKSGRSGLGLTIVQKTLEVMGAEFALEQTENGVLFRVDLPGI